MTVAADSVVFVTYPGHLLCTAVALRYFRQHYQCDQPVYVIYDDIAQGSDPGYFRLCRYLYQHVSLIPMSDFGVADLATGWIRQQMVKMSLDRVLPEHTWLCIDGDTIVSAELDRPHVPIRSVSASVPNLAAAQKLDNRFRCYVEDCGLGYFDPAVWPEAVRTNAIPVRWLDRDTLVGLRDWVSLQKAQDWDQLHRAWFSGDRSEIEQRSRLMTEFELLENYQREILRRELPLVPYQIRYFGNDWPRDRHWIGTFWGRDADVADRVWQKWGISQSDINSAKNFTKSLT